MKTSVKVGLTTVFLLFSIAVLIMWKSDLQFKASGYKLVGEFSNVGGLLQGANVRYRGFRVGRVSDIVPSPRSIKVTFWIKKDIEVPKGSKAKILFDGLVGENYLSIDPNIGSREVLKHGDILQGTSGSDLANFIDLGSQNLIHTEAILESIRELVTADDVNKNIRNILVSFDKVATELNKLISTLNQNDNSGTIAETLSNFNKFSERLAIAGDSILDKDSVEDLKNTIQNLERLTNNINRYFPERYERKKPRTSNFLSTIATMELDTNASVQYASKEETAYYQAGLDLDLGRHFVRTGVGDRNGENQFLHLQHGVHLSEKVTSRVGLFYEKAGLGIDYFLTPRARMSVEVYDADDLKVDVLGQYAILREIDILLGVRKNNIDKKFNNVDLGLNYHF